MISCFYRIFPCLLPELDTSIPIEDPIGNNEKPDLFIEAIDEDPPEIILRSNSFPRGYVTPEIPEGDENSEWG